MRENVNLIFVLFCLKCMMSSILDFGVGIGRLGVPQYVGVVGLVGIGLVGSE